MSTPYMAGVKDTANKYLDDYITQLHDSLRTVDLDFFYGIIDDCAVRHVPIVVFGNGGSCAVAEHLSCDFLKGIAHDTDGRIHPRVESLVSNQSLITAIANDYGYDQIFAKQIEYLKHQECLALAISSSGSSPNIVAGLRAANAKGYLCAALVGFDGGIVVAQDLAATLTIHIKSNNYGVVEDAHSVIMHALAQKIRLKYATNPVKLRL